MIILANNTGFSVADMQSFLRENMGIIIKDYTARYFLNEFGFTWSSQPVYYGVEYQEDMIKELTRFLLQYSHAIYLESNSDQIIVASDES